MKKYPYPPEENPENYEQQEKAQKAQNETMNSISAGDCTGLIPANPDDEEYDSYAELYSFLPPDIKQ